MSAFDSPIIVLLAVNVSVPAETGDFAVEALTAVGALKAGRVPPPVHRLKVKPVGYPEAASGANHPRHIVGLRGWGGRRLQFRDSVQVFGGLLLLRVSLRVQMRVMVVMVVVGRLRGHAQVAWVLEVAAVPVLLPTWRISTDLYHFFRQFRAQIIEKISIHRILEAIKLFTLKLN